MNFTRQDYHTDRDRGMYITSAGWNRSPFTTDTFGYTVEVSQDRKYVNHKDSVAASESTNNQLLRYMWESWMWDWYSDKDQETNTKEIKAADNDNVDKFLA